MLHPFLKFLVPPLICIGKSCLRWSNFTFIDSPACCLFVCHVFVCLFLCFLLFLQRKFFSVVFLLYDAFVFQKAESMTRGCWPTLDYFITCSYTLHHPEGDPCESWGSGISFKGVTSRAIEKCFLTPAMQAFNTCMSHVRIAVEWLSGDTANYLSL